MCCIVVDMFVDNFFLFFFIKKWGIVGNLCIFAHVLKNVTRKELKINNKSQRRKGHAIHR